MREQTQNEIEMLRKVNRMRTIEIEELAVSLYICSESYQSDDLISLLNVQ